MRNVKTGNDHFAFLVGMCLALMLTCAVVQAQHAQPQSPTQESQTQQAPGEAELLHVLVGQSLEVSSQIRIKRFSVSNPGIIDAAMKDPNHIQIDGKAAGGVSLVVWDETGQSQIFYVYVDLNDPSLAGQLSGALPDKSAPMQVQRKGITWLIWVVIPPVVLLAGAVLLVRRRRHLYLCNFELQESKLGSLNGNSEARLAASYPTRAENHPAKETFTDGLTRQAEDLEKVAQELGGRWSEQFQEQVEAAVKKLREEVKDSAQMFEESKRQLASLAEAKLASLSQALRDEYGQQLVQALREHAQATHEAADVEVESIKQAAQEAVAQLQVAEQKEETSFKALAGAVEERLRGVSMAVEALEGRVGALVEDFQGKGTRQAEDLEKVAQELGGRWSEQFQEQVEAAVEKLREEVKDSARVVEESKRQLANLVEVKLATLNQVAADATAGLKAEWKRSKDQYETSRSGFAVPVPAYGTRLSTPSFQRGTAPARQRVVVKLALLAAAILVIMTSVLGVYLSKVPVMQLQPEAPAEFIDQSPDWGPKRRARETELAQAYWHVAIVSLQEKYPFGSELPAEPPTEFQIDRKYAPAGGAKAFSDTRAHYWEKLRRCWGQRQSWVERNEENTQWAARLWQIWDRSHLRRWFERTVYLHAKREAAP